MSTIFGLSTLKNLDAAAACRHIYLFLQRAINWTGGSATIKGQSRQRTRVITKYNCCKYKDTQRFQIELLQIQRHTEIPNTNAANAKKHRTYKYNCCKDTTKNTHNQFQVLSVKTLNSRNYNDQENLASLPRLSRIPSQIEITSKWIRKAKLVFSNKKVGQSRRSKCILCQNRQKTAARHLWLFVASAICGLIDVDALEVAFSTPMIWWIQTH